MTNRARALKESAASCIMAVNSWPKSLPRGMSWKAYKPHPVATEELMLWKGENVCRTATFEILPWYHSMFSVSIYAASILSNIVSRWLAQALIRRMKAILLLELFLFTNFRSDIPCACNCWRGSSASFLAKSVKSINLYKFWEYQPDTS